MTRAAQKHFVAQKYGKILNLSSVSALGNRGQANYSAAKMGVQGFTRTLGIELGPFGVNANAIAPGFIATEMTDATAARLKIERRGLPRRRRRGQPGPPGRLPRGHRGRRGVPVQRRGVVHHRPDAVRRRRRQARLTPAGRSCAAPAVAAWPADVPVRARRPSPAVGGAACTLESRQISPPRVWHAIGQRDPCAAAH